MGVQTRKSMSVPEMGRMLGLGKTESYYLIRKNYFDVITVGKKMRIMIDSFENWYSNQTKYQKVDGTPPGKAISEYAIPVDKLGELLGISEASAYELIAKVNFEIVPILGKRCISKESFERWYSNQSEYITRDDLEAQSEIIEATYSVPEICRMLNVNRNNVHYLVTSGKVKSVKVGRHTRVYKDSFQQWFESHITNISKKGENR